MKKLAVSKIKVINIIGTVSSLDEVSRICGKSGFFEPINVLDFYKKTENFEPYSEENPYAALIKKIKDISASFNKDLNFVNIENFNVDFNEISGFINNLESKVKVLDSEKKELINKINNLEKSLKLLKHFCGLNLDLDEISRCEYVKIRFGRISKEGYKKLENSKKDFSSMFFPCSEEENYFWGIYFAPVENLKEVDDLFSEFYFEYVDIPKEDCAVTPEESVKKLEKSIESEKQKLKEIEQKFIKMWSTHKDQCFRFYTKLNELDAYFGIKKRSYIHDESFLLMGWVPEEDEVSFCNMLDYIDGIEYSLDSEDEIAESDLETNLVPVKLKNNWFAKPFETFVKMYGFPKFSEFDPTLFVAITYTLIYGIMFGDLGHGIALFLAGIFLKKFKNFSLAPIMTRCGVSASLFGTLYGSFFGFEKALNPFYRLVFGLNEKPVEVMSSATIPKVLAFSVLLGVILIFTAMLIKTISSFIIKDIENGIFGSNGICGLVFYGSLIVGAVLQLALNIKVINLTYILLLLVVPLILMFFKTPLANLILKKEVFSGQTVGEYILQNVFEMFTVILEYITNTVSFLRVGAYVLVHAGLMMAVFIIANMFPNALISSLVLFVGNLFVIGFEGLLVGIQVLRLEFYEIFSRCFSGGGREFNPVKVTLKVN